MALLQSLYNGDELNGGEVVDGLRIGMIPQWRLLALDHEDVLDAQYRCIEQIRL